MSGTEVRTIRARMLRRATPTSSASDQPSASDRPSVPDQRSPEQSDSPALGTTELHGHWSQPAPGRLIGVLVVAVAGVAAGVGLALTVVQPSTGAVALLAVGTIVAVMTYGSLALASPTTVTLTGPVLEVRRGELHDVFDLAGPIRRLRTEGRPNRPNWRLRMETADGRLVELDPAQVDPMVITAAIERYRPR
jgi:hypothetical protein